MTIKAGTVMRLYAAQAAEQVLFSIDFRSGNNDVLQMMCAREKGKTIQSLEELERLVRSVLKFNP